MLVLGMNTAFGAIEAALVQDGEILRDLQEQMPRGQERSLPGLIDTLCTSVGVSLSEVGRIGVVTGPGSFTGLRIGVSYARGLALVTGAAAIGVTSLEAAIPDGLEGPALGCLAAQRRPPDQTWWVQGVDRGEGIADVIEIPLVELAGMLAGIHVPVFIDGADALGSAASQLDLRPMRPSAITAAIKAAHFDPLRHPPSPVYARSPDAALPPPKPVI